jgi:hypothetical protein
MEEIVYNVLIKFLTEQFSYNCNNLSFTYEIVDFNSLNKIKELITLTLVLAGYKVLDNSDCLPIYNIEFKDSQFILNTNLEIFKLDLKNRYDQFLQYQVEWAVKKDGDIKLVNWLNLRDDSIYFKKQLDYFTSKYYNVVNKSIFHTFFGWWTRINIIQNYNSKHVAILL